MTSGSRARKHALGILASLGLLVGMLAIGGLPALAEASTISSFTPTSGGIGEAVTITGTNFVSVTSVGFNGVTAAFTVPSATTIETSVPALASTGPISVTASGVTTTSATDFTVTLGLMLSASSGQPTSRIRVAGSAFGADEKVDLSFDGTKLAHVDADENGNFTGASLPIPASAKPGTHTVSARGRTSRERDGAAFLVRTDWPQYRGGPTHLGFNPYENVLSVSNVGRLAKDWIYATGDEVYSSPTVVGGVLYIGSRDGNLYALDASTGSLQWSYPDGTDSSPVVRDGVVYVGAHDALALDAETGDLLWMYPSDAGFSSPAVVDGAVYLVTYDGIATALDASTGALLWSHAIQGYVASSPAVANGAVIFGSIEGSRGAVYSLDASTGDLRWRYRTTSYILSSPAVKNGVVYIGVAEGRLFALKALTGARIWGSASRGFGSSPAVTDGVIYAGTGYGDVDALSSSTGALVWRFHAGGGDVDSSPTVANGVVYVGSNGDVVYALDASTGKELWSYLTGQGIRSAPTIVNGTVYVGSKDGKVYAFGLS